MWVVTALAAPEVLRFESGLRAVIERAEGTGWIATSMTFDGAGEADVPEGREHLAHLVEHLWFRASTPQVDATHHGELFAWGCDGQAYTWPLTMEFLTTCPADVTDRLLALHRAQLDDAMHGITERDVQIELDVVALEIGAYRETSRTAVARAVAARLHPDTAWAQRMRREGTGDELDLQTIRSWSTGRLRADRAVLGIVSPFSAEELRPKLEAAFGPVVSTEAVGPLTKPPRTPRRTLRVDVRDTPANVDEPVVVTSWELPLDAAQASRPLAGIMQFALHAMLGPDARFDGANCFDHVVGQATVVTCSVNPTPGSDLRAFAETVREASDVRSVLGLGLVRKALRHVVEQQAEEPVLGTLLPIAFNRPSILAHRMVNFNRVFDERAPRIASRRAAKRLQRAAIEALDPQRALVLAITPDGIERSLPTVRSADPVPRRMASAPPPADRPARIVRFEGGLGISRPDLETSWVVSFEGRVAADAQPIADTTAWSALSDPQRVVIGPVITESSATPGEVETVTYGAPDPVIAGVATRPITGPIGEISWECRIAGAQGPALLVWRELVAWRAWHALRDETGWAYTPVVQAAADGLRIEADVLPGATAQAVTAMQAELTAIRLGAFDAAELRAAVRRASVVASPGLALLPHWPSLLLGPSHLRTARELHDLAAGVAAVDADAVTEIAARCDPSDGWTRTVPEQITGPDEAEPPRSQ